MTSNRPLVLFGLVAVLAACSTSAPPLPADTTSLNHISTVTKDEFSSQDLDMSCAGITEEEKKNEFNIEEADKAIEANRQNNEVAGYFGGIFVLPLAAMQTNSEEKDQIAALNQRQDVLIKLSTFKECPL